MSDEPLLYTKRDDGVAIVSTNDDPLNRMTLEYVDRLSEVVDEIAADDSIRAFVITAEGTTNFSVGMNLKQLPEGVQRAGSPEALFDQRRKRPLVEVVLAVLLDVGVDALVEVLALAGALELDHVEAEGVGLGLRELDEFGSLAAQLLGAEGDEQSADDDHEQRNAPLEGQPQQSHGAGASKLAQYDEVDQEREQVSDQEQQ